jgi:N-acetyl-gamma-glutamyl-phosphate reductase
MHMESRPITAAVIGAAGYSGAELLGILRRHPHVRLGPLFAASNAGKPVGDVLPALRGLVDRTLESYTPDAVGDCDVIFIALPSGEAMGIVPELLRRGTRVIDLGGDFRLKDPSLYRTYYTREHTATGLLPDAVFGLPEWNRPAIRGAKLLSNPGCYATSAILPLVPLLKAGLVSPSGIVINALSGVSGAGRSASVEMSFAEVNESVRPYKVGVHQHTPEIEQACAMYSGQSTTVTFVPHLLPITRGILATIAAPTVRSIAADQVRAVLEEAYADAPFVRLVSGVPEIRNVNHTNFIDIGWTVDARNNRILLLSAIDNLVKGAAGQAVQNMNLMFGFDETEALR